MRKLLRSLLAVVLIPPTATSALNPPSSPINLTSGVAAVTGADNRYCSPQGTWLGPTTDGPAKLPTSCMYTAMSATPMPGATRGPDSTTAQVQADLNAAACGDRILVQAGSSIGSINWPHKGCDNAHWIGLLSTGITDPAFPPEGTRLTPCWSGVASMPNRAYPCTSAKVLTFKIVAPASGNAITATGGGDHIRIIGAELTRNPAGGIAVYNIVDLSGTPSWLIFDRVWCHGVENTFPIAVQSSDTSTTRCIYLGQSNHVAVIDSYFTDFYDTSAMSANGNTDAQCVGGGSGGIANSGWGVYKFVNNHCEASGEGILLGGSSGPSLTPAGCTILVNCNVDVAADIEVRRNYFFKPPQWNGNTTTPGGTGWPVVKNGFEMKMGVRALFEGNVIENCWYNAQVCYAFSVAPVNQQSGGATPTATCPTCVVTDFTYRYNYAYSVAYGIAVYSFMPAGCPTCQTQGSNRVSIHDNLIGDNLNLGNLSGQSAGDEMEILATNDSTSQGLNKIQNLNISHNTFVKGIRSLTIFGGPTGNLQMVNFTLQNNIWSYANFGWGNIGNTNGCDTPFGFSNNAYSILQACVTNWTADHNAVFNWNGGTLGAKWPTDGKGAGNFFVNGSAGVGFVNYGTGDSGFNPGNYQLTAISRFHNAASDGKDLGADIPALLQAISGVRQ